MQIFTPSLWFIDRWLFIGQKIAIAILMITATSFSLCYFLSPSNESTVASQHLKEFKRPSSFFSYETIGLGALSLRPRYAFGWVCRLAEELLVISYNSRPDAHLKTAEILLSLKQEKQMLTLTSGEIIYLKESSQGKGLLFSREETALCIQPLLLDNGTLLIQAKRQFEGASTEEQGEFVLNPQKDHPCHYNIKEQRFLKEMQTGVCFSHDQLIEKYGGKEYSHWKNKKVLELGTSTKPYACFVSTGDYLMFNEGYWQVVPYEELKTDCPISRIKAISHQWLEVEIWDETGFWSSTLKLEMQKPTAGSLKTENILTKARLRSASQVSCSLDKRRVILKVGDWLLKTPLGWRRLKRKEEIEQYLNHRLKGELFIFDSIQKEQARFEIKGHLFDETRMQVQAVCFPIDAEKFQNRKSRSRKVNKI